MAPQRIFSALAISAVTLSTVFSTTIAQTVPRSVNNRSTNDGTLTMVMVDQAQLSSTQRNAFQRYLQTANLPRTKVGKRCQFYGKPEVWCLLLEENTAQQVYNQLRKQRDFGSATAIQEVRRLTIPEKS